MAKGNKWSDISNLNETLELQEKLNSSVNGYLESLKKIDDIQKDINVRTKAKVDIEAKIKDLNDKVKLTGVALSTEERKQLKIYVNQNEYLEKNLLLLEQQKKELIELVKQTNKLTLGFKAVGKAIVKGIGNLPNIIDKGYNTLKSTGLFDMDKAIRTSSLSMGLLGKQSESFKTSVLTSAQGLGKLDGLTAELGVSVEDIAKNQADYSDELGRTVMLGEKGNKAIAELAKGTVLGSEGAAKMAAELDNFGMSAERVSDFMSQALQDASQLGLNAGKVTKNIQHNIKMLNKYNFKDGVKGLQKMAMTASKLGIDMNAIAPMADKLFDIEGAVEMSAQLQVLGGAWSQLADPFKLMYMARNDVDGLTNSLGEAAAASMHLAKDGTIQMSTVEMSRLRKIAEQTGVAYDDIVKAGKNVARFKIIEPQLGFKADDKEKEFLENVAQLDDKGKAFIEIGLGPDGKVIRKYINELGSAGKDVIQQQMKEKATLADRAKAAMTFDDKVTNIINALKVSLYPIVDMMDKKLIPKLQNFSDRFVKEGWGDKITEFATVIGKLVTTIGGFIIDNPLETAFIIGAAKFTSFMFDNAKWFLNGIALSEGFNSSMLGTGGIGTWAKSFGKLAAPVLGTALGTWGGIELGKKTSEHFGNKDTMTGDVAGVAGGLVGGVAGGALLGGVIGSVVPVLGTAIGAAIGAGIGALGGKALGDWAATPDGYNPNQKTIKSDDSVIKFNPNDKFTKVNDGTMIAGTNANGNASLARSISSMMAPGQNSSTGAISPATTNVNLSDLKVSGSIELKINQSMSRELGENLLHDANFIRNISRLINMSISQNTNMVQKA